MMRTATIPTAPEFAADEFAADVAQDTEHADPKPAQHTPFAPPCGFTMDDAVQMRRRDDWGLPPL